MYGPLCALRTYLRAVWWSHLELGEGCRLEDICIYIYIYILYIYYIYIIYIYIYIYPLIYTPLLKDTRVYYVGVEHKVEGKANGNLYPLRKSPSVRMSIKPQCTVTVWQCWRNEAQLAKHVKELLASLVVITLHKQL